MLLFFKFGEDGLTSGESEMEMRDDATVGGDLLFFKQPLGNVLGGEMQDNAPVFRSFIARALR